MATYPKTMNQARFEQVIQYVQWPPWRPWTRFHQHSDHLYCYQGNLNSLVVINKSFNTVCLGPAVKFPSFLICSDDRGCLSILSQSNYWCYEFKSFLINNKAFGNVFRYSQKSFHTFFSIPNKRLSIILPIQQWNIDLNKNGKGPEHFAKVSKLFCKFRIHYQKLFDEAITI